MEARPLRAVRHVVDARVDLGVEVAEALGDRLDRLVVQARRAEQRPSPLHVAGLQRRDERAGALSASSAVSRGDVRLVARTAPASAAGSSARRRRRGRVAGDGQLAVVAFVVLEGQLSTYSPGSSVRVKELDRPGARFSRSPMMIPSAFLSSISSVFDVPALLTRELDRAGRDRCVRRRAARVGERRTSSVLRARWRRRRRRSSRSHRRRPAGGREQRAATADRAPAGGQRGRLMRRAPCRRWTRCQVAVEVAAAAARRTARSGHRT